MDRHERLALLDRNAQSRDDLVAQIEERRALADAGALPDTSAFFRDAPQPGRPLVRREYTAPRTYERGSGAADAATRAFVMATIEVLGDEVAAVTGRMQREISELKGEVAALRADLEIVRARKKPSGR